MDTESELLRVRGRVTSRNSDHFYSLLAQIDLERAGRRLAADLQSLVRRQLIRSLVVRHRLHSAVASRVEAPAWTAAWAACRNKHLLDIFIVGCGAVCRPTD